MNSVLRECEAIPSVWKKARILGVSRNGEDQPTITLQLNRRKSDLSMTVWGGRSFIIESFPISVAMYNQLMGRLIISGRSAKWHLPTRNGAAHLVMRQYVGTPINNLLAVSCLLRIYDGKDPLPYPGRWVIVQRQLGYVEKHVVIATEPQLTINSRQWEWERENREIVHLWVDSIEKMDAGDWRRPFAEIQRTNGIRPPQNTFPQFPYEDLTLLQWQHIQEVGYPLTILSDWETAIYEKTLPRWIWRHLSDKGCRPRHLVGMNREHIMDIPGIGIKAWRYIDFTKSKIYQHLLWHYYPETAPAPPKPIPPTRQLKDWETALYNVALSQRTAQILINRQIPPDRLVYLSDMGQLTTIKGIGDVRCEEIYTRSFYLRMKVNQMTE